ncbi:MAG: hypothetical protein RL172_2432, partial [Bacteroidota bacterium]
MTQLFLKQQCFATASSKARLFTHCYAVPFIILFQYSQGSILVFSSHILQRGLAWLKGNV